ncbi:MAG: glycosyltransferase [Myxococcota bacterium]
MRLAIHAGTLRGFGSGIVGRAILDGLRHAEGVDALLALVPTEWPDEALTQAPDAQGTSLTIHRLAPGFRAKLLGENLTLRRLLKAWKADALLSLTDTSLIGCPVPHVLMVQQAFVAYPPERITFALPTHTRRRFKAMSLYMRLGLRDVDLVSVQSAHMKEAFCARWGFPAERVTVIPSTVQPAARKFAQGPLTSPDSPPYLAYVSGPGPHKNHAVLAPMMAALRLTHPALRCLVTVQPEAVPELVDAARDLSVYDRFEFAGSLVAEEAMARLSQASVAVLPSRIESFGIPYHEALALGIPAVAADVPCAREALGTSGSYAPTDDGALWAERVREVLAHQAVRAQAARAQFAATTWSWADIAQAYAAMAQDAIGRR